MFRTTSRVGGSGRVRRGHVGGRWRLERLEDRTTPAGDVLATQAGSFLTLIGDDLGNSILLLPGGAPNEVVVQGVGTTVNGSSGPQLFTGVENLVAHLLGGNDVLTADGVDITATSFSQVFVDGNAGDDRIEFLNSTIVAGDFVGLEIYGERVIGGFASGTSGNDTISLSGTTITAGVGGSFGFVSVRIYGETNDGGVVTGGNDTISIADSTIAATGFFTSIQMELVGDANTAAGGQTASVGSGNDAISISNSTISATGVPFGFGNNVSLTIVGDFNNVTGFPGGDTSATVDNGNDRIDVTGTTVAATGEGVNQLAVNIVGDRNFVAGFLPGAPTTATVGGGNDVITIAGTTFNAVGGFFNGNFVEIRGEDIQAQGPDGATSSTIGGGNDRIDVNNVDILTGGGFGNSAALIVRSEYATLFGPVTSVVGGGNDRVNVVDVQVPGNPLQDFSQIIVQTGSGNDRVTIADSAALNFIVDLAEGNDVLDFNSNTVGLDASLEGGPGHDRLRAHGNTGLLIWFGFEDADVT